MPTPMHRHPLTPTQHSMCRHALARPHGAADGTDVEQLVGRLPEVLDPDCLRGALADLVERHQMLRVRIAESDGEPVAEVLPQMPIELTVHDLRGQARQDLDRVLEDLLSDDRSRGFDLKSGPLLRCLMVPHDAGTLLVVTVSHVVCDGRSFAPLLLELFGHYDHRRGGRAPTLSAGPSFAEWIESRAGRVQSGSQDYWRHRLEGASLPTPLPHCPHLEVPGHGAGQRGTTQMGRIEMRLAVEDCQKLRARLAREMANPDAAVHGAFALLLARHAGTEEDVVFGAVLSERGQNEPVAATIGCFVQTLPLRIPVADGQEVGAFLRQVRARRREQREHPLPLLELHGLLPATAPHTRLFDSLVVFDRRSLQEELKAAGPRLQDAQFSLQESTGFGLTLSAYDDEAMLLRLAYDKARYAEASARALLARLATILSGFAVAETLAEVPWLPAPERRRLIDTRHGAVQPIPQGGVHEAILNRCRLDPGAVAVHAEDGCLSYRELAAESLRLARALTDLGVGRGSFVGLAMGRSRRLLVAMLAILRTGAAYVPLDPGYPSARLEFVIHDAQIRFIVADHLGARAMPAGVRVLDLETLFAKAIDEAGDCFEDPPTAPDAPAYVIYTSGSTGQPKGVVVTHGNVQSFCAAMDEQLSTSKGVWLAVTSIAFDISVLELLWTLRLGHQVLLYDDSSRQTLDMSLFYFAAADDAGSDKYRLLREGAKLADAKGFCAVWTPERHFHPFGGLYPNPSVTAAALATWTHRLQIRAGSVVLPLHHPLRVAEEWAMVDNLSGGRVSISVASGWHPVDFALQPTNHAERRSLMYETLATVQALWRGETRTFETPVGPKEIGIWPRPVQKELPVWLTAAGNPETFATAGRLGAFLLTHLLGQNDADLARNIQAYRAAWAAAGHDGRGRVAVMLHTFVGDDDASVKELVRGPMVRYLESSLDLVRNFAGAWTAYKQGAGAPPTSDAFEKLSAAERNDLLQFAFERYYQTSGLFGPIERCQAMLERMHNLGADEIACLIDFGVDEDLVLEMLPRLAMLRTATRAPSPAAFASGHKVTHLQCTPSRARFWLADPANGPLFQGLETVLLGGEALDRSVVDQLRRDFHGRLLNVYGPTETTVWSTLHPVQDSDEIVPIGQALQNERVFVVDARLAVVPDGVVGELLIGGAGVATGYLHRPELNAERFVVGPDGSRCYRTGDRVRRRADGVLIFLGRNDQQVKLRGYRIELGEVEESLRRAGAREAAAAVLTEGGEPELVAFVVGATAEQLKSRLREEVPQHLRPTRFIELPTLPLTPNGKLDRKALPALAVQGTHRPASAPKPAVLPDAPATHSAPVVPAVLAPTMDPAQITRRLCEIWCEVLQVPEVRADDNFFDLGGHSLLAVQVHGRLQQEFGRVTITDLFRFPTVATLAAHLARQTVKSEPKVEAAAASVAAPEPVQEAAPQAGAQGRVDRARIRQQVEQALRRARGAET